MGLPPKGEVVARVPVVRACGHTQDFLEHRADKYKAQRLAKFQRTRCPDCATRLMEQQKKAQPPRKGEALKQLPPGTRVTLTRAADGSWGGTLSAEGVSVEEAASESGAQALVAALAQRWAVARAQGGGEAGQG